MTVEDEMREAVVRGGDNWRVVGEIVTTSASRQEAAARLRVDLGVTADGAEAILDQPVERWLPENLNAMRQDNTPRG